MCLEQLYPVFDQGYLGWSRFYLGVIVALPRFVWASMKNGEQGHGRAGFVSWWVWIAVGLVVIVDGGGNGYDRE